MLSTAPYVYTAFFPNLTSPSMMLLALPSRSAARLPVPKCLPPPYADYQLAAVFDTIATLDFPPSAAHTHM